MTNSPPSEHGAEISPTYMDDVLRIAGLAMSETALPANLEKRAIQSLNGMVEALLRRRRRASRSTWIKERSALSKFLETALDESRKREVKEVVESRRNQRNSDRIDFLRTLLEAPSDEIESTLGKVRSARLEKDREITPKTAAPDAGKGPSLFDHSAVVVADHDQPGSGEISTGFEPLESNELGMLRNALRKREAPVNLLEGDPSRKTGLVASLMLEGSWLTGLRPIEWFQCSAYVGETLDDLEPAFDALQRRLASETEAPVTLEVIERACTRMFDEASKAFLRVRNAKSLMAEMRDMPVERIIEITDMPAAAKLKILVLSTLSRVPERRRETMMRNIQRIIRRRSLETLPHRKPVNLYTARHDFADRAKAVFTRAEVMALMGHTSRKTPSWYGRKGRRQGSSGRGGMMISPDPVLVQLMETLLHVDAGTRETTAGGSPETAPVQPEGLE